MFGLGMMEIGVIVALALMLFPAKELPKLVRSIARMYGQIRRTAEDFRNTVLEDEDLREPIEEIKGAYNDARFEVRDAERKARQQLAKAQMDLRMATARRIQAERELEKASEKTQAAEDAQGDAKSATAKGAVRIAAADDDDDDDDVHGPIAGADPRTFSAPRPVGPAPVEGDEPREGVA